MKMDSERRRPFAVKVNLPNLESLKDLSDKLTRFSRPSFISKYGNIHDLLFTNVPADAITALTQFYDPPMRSFLFKDFQLAPTLEEFSKILDTPSKGKGPYVEIKHSPKPEDLAVALNIDVREFVDNMIERRKIKSIPSSFLEKKAREFATTSKTNDFINTLALLIYGLVLFPSFEGFIHPDAISVFWAVLVKDQEPIPELLADVHYDLFERHDKRKGSMACCLPLLYRWITTLLPGDYTQWNKFKGDDWSQFLVSLTGSSICWHALKIADEVIISCGEFPNVPLIGSKACISYNPILSMRQLGSHMRDKPEDSSLEGMVIHDVRSKDDATVQRIVQAWKNVHKVGHRLKRKSGANNETYPQWIEKRVQEVRLPFRIKTPAAPLDPESAPISIEEADELRATVARLRKEKEEMEVSLLKVARENCELKWNETQKKEDIQSLEKELEVVKEKKLHVSDALEGQPSVLKHRNEKIKSLEGRNGYLVKVLEKSNAERAKLKEELEAERQGSHRELEAQRERFRSMVEDFENLLQWEKEYGERRHEKSNFDLNQEQLRVIELESALLHMRTQFENLQRNKDEWRNRFYLLMEETQDGEYYQQLRQERDLWMNRFAKLAELANAAIYRFLDGLRVADALVNPLETPPEIQEFIESCFKFVKDFRERIRREM